MEPRDVDAADEHERPGGGADDGRDDEAADLALTAPEVLLALALLDREAATACRIAANLSEPGFRERLHEHAEDHLRHAAELQELLARTGGPALSEAGGADAPLLPTLARLAGPLGRPALLLALLHAEQLANLSYENALAYEWDRETEQLLERNLADEQRHLEWLAGDPAEEQPGEPA